jgi:SAM-dependent methyltransferase
MDALIEEGDAYYNRNIEQHEPEHDPIIEIIDALGITSVLEVGSVNGWRLARLRDRYGCAVHGIEASGLAVAEHRNRYSDIPVEHGTAPDAMAGLSNDSFDLIICGFMLYLLPRADLFCFAAEVDRLLRVGGYILIEDFLAPNPHSRDYTHRSDLRVFKHDPSSPWLWSPTYTLLDRRLVNHHAHITDNSDPDRWIVTDLIGKLSESVAYPGK